VINPPPPFLSNATAPSLGYCGKITLKIVDPHAEMNNCVGFDEGMGEDVSNMVDGHN